MKMMSSDYLLRAIQLRFYMIGRCFLLFEVAKRRTGRGDDKKNDANQILDKTSKTLTSRRKQDPYPPHTDTHIHILTSSFLLILHLITLLIIITILLISISPPNLPQPHHSILIMPPPTTTTITTPAIIHIHIHMIPQLRTIKSVTTTTTIPRPDTDKITPAIDPIPIADTTAERFRDTEGLNAD